MKLKEIISETKFGQGTSISDYEKYADWIRQAKEQCFDKFDEDEATWKDFEIKLSAKTSKHQVAVFMDEPSADQLHYNSNGRPDQGKTLEFLENFEDFQRAFDKLIAQS